MSIPEHILVSRLVAWIAGGVFATAWLADPDLWGHLRFGLDAIRDRALTSVDPYSFTSDVQWINHEWLSEVVLGLAYLTGDNTGLMLSKASVVLCSYAVMASRLRSAPAAARWWVLTLVIVACHSLTLTWRPQVWTMLGVTVLTATVEWPLRRKALLWPPMFALWANLHGGWLVGLGVLGALTIGRVLDDRDIKDGVMGAAVLIFCAIATLATPYRLELWDFVWRTVGFGRSDITEWRAVWSSDVVGLALWLLTALAAGVALKRDGWRWSAMLPVLMLAAASLRVTRLGPLFTIAVAMLLWGRGAATPIVFSRPLLALLTVATLVPSGVIVRAQRECVVSAGSRPPDASAAGALIEAKGRIMVPFDWGQYALWHFGPDLQVSFDGRRETVYSQQTIDLMHGLLSGDLRLAPWILERHPEYVWLTIPEGVILAAHLAQNGYREDVRTEHSIILRRADLAPLTSRPMSTCFP